MDNVKHRAIVAKDYVNQFLTNEDGQVLFNVISPLLKNGERIIISFRGVDSLPSSFVNTAFVPILNFLSLEQIKKQLTFSNTTSQINKMIKMRIFDEAKLKHN